MKYVELTNSNIVAQVDDCDYEKILNFKWRIALSRHGNIKGVTMTYRSICENTYHKFMLHSFILFGGARIEEGKVIHHIDGNPLNNQRENLLVCTSEEHRKLHL